MEKRRKTSEIWNYFTVVTGDIASCNSCNRELSYRTSTTNLRKHIKSKHPTVMLLTKSSSCVTELRLPDDGLELYEEGVATPKGRRKRRHDNKIDEPVERFSSPIVVMGKSESFGAYVAAQLSLLPPEESDRLEVDIHNLIYQRKQELARESRRREESQQPMQSSHQAHMSVQFQPPKSPEPATSPKSPQPLPTASPKKGPTTHQQDLHFSPSS